MNTDFVSQLRTSSASDQQLMLALRTLANGVSDRIVQATRIAWLALTLGSVAVLCLQLQSHRRIQAAATEIEQHRDQWRGRIAVVEQLRDAWAAKDARAQQLLNQLEAIRQQQQPIQPQVRPNGIDPDASEVSSL